MTARLTAFSQNEVFRTGPNTDTGTAVNHPPANTAHISHDSILALGYDWSRVSDPNTAPKYPAKVYLPRTVGDIVNAVVETKKLGQKLRIRGSGHSSNDLVLDEGGAVLWTTLFNNIVDVDPVSQTVVVQSGAMLHAVDDHLATLGFGLPVLGDHTHLTAGGFASVGGISPASHREGMFVDNVLAMEMIDWNGNRRHYTRTADSHEMNRILGGTGQHGVIAHLTLRIERFEKNTTVVENDRFITRDMAAFTRQTRKNIEDANGDILYQRSLWDERNAVGRRVTFGQCTAYKATKQTFWKKLRERIAFGALHTLRDTAGKLPATLGRVVNTISGLGFVFTPRYSTIKNIENFTEKVVDHTVGDPVRFFAMLAPMSTFEELFATLHEIATRYRDEHDCLTSVTLYVVGLQSEWLADGTGEKYCDLLLYLGVKPEKLSSQRIERLVSEIDKACIAHSAYRYMHSRTSKDDQIRSLIDPNDRHTQRLTETKIIAAE